MPRIILVTRNVVEPTPTGKLESKINFDLKFSTQGFHILQHLQKVKKLVVVMEKRTTSKDHWSAVMINDWSTLVIVYQRPAKQSYKYVNMYSYM